MPARFVPAFELRDGFLQLGAGGRAEDLPDRRPHLHHADVLGGCLVHRRDELFDPHLFAAGDVRFDVVADELHSVDGPVGVDVVGRRPFRRGRAGAAPRCHHGIDVELRDEVVMHIDTGLRRLPLRSCRSGTADRRGRQA